MAHRKDFVPDQEEKFRAFVIVFCAAVVTHAAALGIPAALVTEITAKLAAYLAAADVCEQPNAGKVDRETRKLARTALTVDIRKVKNAYIDADPLGAVTNDIRMDFGLEPKDDIRTDVPAPTEVVPFELESGEYLQIVVKHPAKPKGYNGAVARYTVSVETPPDHTFLTMSKLLTRPRELLTFEESQLGQTLHISMQWQNLKGELGPWAPIQSKVIS
jgi:hypothetical protein